MPTECSDQVQGPKWPLEMLTYLLYKRKKSGPDNNNCDDDDDNDNFQPNVAKHVLNAAKVRLGVDLVILKRTKILR